MRPCLTYPPWASLLSAVLLKYLHAWAQDMVQTNILCHRDKLGTRTARVSLFWFFLISCLAKNIQARTRAWALHKTCEPGCSSPALASKQRLISLSLSLSLFFCLHMVVCPSRWRPSWVVIMLLVAQVVFWLFSSANIAILMWHDEYFSRAPH